MLRQATRRTVAAARAGCGCTAVQKAAPRRSLIASARAAVDTAAARTSLAAAPVRSFHYSPIVASRGQNAGALGQWYTLVARSNVTYVLYIVLGSAVLTTIWSGGIDMMWASSNKGKLYDDIDWDKFESLYVEDDDDDDDDDDEDDDEDGRD